MSNQTLALSGGATKPLLTIERRSGWVPLELADIWRFRDLLITLAGRDIRLRYRQTALGVTWVVLQPLVAAGLFTFVFGLLGNLTQANGPPYFLVSYTGMLAFTVFNSTLTKAGMCLVGNAQLVSKVYFPRMILPLSTAVSSLLDFAIGLAVLALLILFYQLHSGTAAHLHIGWGLLLLPVWLLVLLMLALGVGLFASALTVSYRDVQYILPVLLQFAMYASPVPYALVKVIQNEKTRDWLWLYMLNPLASVVEAFRWSCLGSGDLMWGYLGYSIVFSIVVLFAGALAFRRMERTFADII
jgi:lipopolysaccharide transport system permease protein